MSEFWEEHFIKNQEAWGFTPAPSAILAKDFFVEKGVKNILIPGIGYGRNAQLFRENGIAVTGIEISQTAIELAQKHYGTDLKIHHGSVTDMPFDENKYDGIFCYALIHLLGKEERIKLIQDCYKQLTDNGYLLFAVVSTKAPLYGKGELISKDYYDLFNGVKMFFYDKASIKVEFEKFGLVEITAVEDIFPFYLVKCQKK
ncbi:MAG: class I SAM-dependent methyltransferase [Crocinitomicaceae bacterium]|nr:class I SAM-dependent methyltransferase [Crocinitomicaceae bacterium]